MDFFLQGGSPFFVLTIMKHSNNFIDLTDKKFGRLKVLEIAEQNKKGQHKWICRCICGNIIKIFGSDLRSFHTQSCGCLKKDLTIKRNTTHKMTNSNEFKIWQAMKTRCYNQQTTRYKDYGGRGITICNEWKNSFETFYEDMGKRPKGLSIDRIDNDKGYFKENCMWATQKQQARNMRTNRNIIYKGEVFCLTDWAEKLNIKKQTLASRLRYGWSIERAFTQTVK